jgi:dihydrodipicolinate synthase/N-acetylneuraminate lyase
MEIRRYSGRERELMHLCAVLSLNYSDEILGKVGSIIQTAHIISETAKNFFESYQEDLQNNNFDNQEYEARLEHFTLLYVKKHFNMELTSYVVA